MTTTTDTTDTTVDHHDADEHDHPSDGTYVKIAAILTVLTAIEVSTYFLENGAVQLSRDFLVSVILVLMVVKFAIVALYFMHLKFDDPIALAGSSWPGILIALAVFIVMLSTMNFWVELRPARRLPREPPSGEPRRASQKPRLMVPAIGGHVMNVDVVDWQAHVEVWLLILGVIGLGFAVQRIIGPKVTAPGESPTTPAQKRWFWSAVVLLWLASDWPIHDVSEEQLYLVHMVQHMLFTLIIPAMFLLAVPEWLARLLVEDERAHPAGRHLAHQSAGRRSPVRPARRVHPLEWPGQLLARVRAVPLRPAHAPGGVGLPVLGAGVRAAA